MFSPDAIRDRCPREFSRDQCYELPARDRPGLRPDVPGHRTGLARGPRIVGAGPASRWSRSGKRRVRVSTRPCSMLAFRSVIPADSDFDERNGGLYLPHEIEAVRLFRRPGRSRVGPRPPAREDASPIGIGCRHLQRRRPARRHGCAACAAIASRVAARNRSTTCSTPISGAPSRDPSRTSCRNRGAGWSSRTSGGIGARLAQQLRARGDACTVVHAGSNFEDCGAGRLPDQSRPVRKMCRGSSRPSSGPIDCRAEASSTLESRRTTSGRLERGRTPKPPRSPGC